ncbi:ribose 5-phosphate isomerase B [Halobacillus karajensis]|uniref:Sugar phosphate isomerase YwlF n=1 Tax=Halobacillus karajensis TaxID=195088 RepID=A0A024P2K0_9BACI|nr:ribose 5-phosphate isomerase B [Halobacillus karajensis]CDQ19379.1 Putative sugar phosphate isomerase YwlF [Halobacillus karajensis]CDQ21842.1 Putative sugar phosphate isomerase YwlF [Halobacillus karajensis]CDQ27682.1 Putative sugar phosphate isomerase YwlF [Halobacillus karajensis]
MKIGIGSDHNGFEFKEEIKKYVEQTTDHLLVDYGCHSCDSVDYPDVAFDVSQAISEGKIDRAILICGTGIGVAIAANKYPGIRAALAHDTYSAERAQLSNNAQIITMGSQIIGTEVGKKVVETYLNSVWAEGSKRKVDKINNKEKEFRDQGVGTTVAGNRCS